VGIGELTVHRLARRRRRRHHMIRVATWEYSLRYRDLQRIWERHGNTRCCTRICSGYGRAERLRLEWTIRIGAIHGVAS